MESAFLRDNPVRCKTPEHSCHACLVFKGWKFPRMPQDVLSLPLSNPTGSLTLSSLDWRLLKVFGELVGMESLLTS